jgi:hypothetical protein
MDVDVYRSAAEVFFTELTREFYRHYAGLQDEYEIAPIYERHRELFTREAVEALRELGARPLLDFAVEGYLGQATKDLEAELAEREATMSFELDGERIGFREAAVRQANEPDAQRRELIERACLELTADRLVPLQREVLELRQAAARELGWRSYRDMCEECKLLDLDALHAQTAAFTAVTNAAYGEVLEPELRRTLGHGLGELRRSDLPRFFRAADQDPLFPASRLIPSFIETMHGLGIDIRRQEGVILDVEPRPRKSPRAFCAPVRVPGEVYLVIAPIGGADDYRALFHEGGHTEHYANVDAGLAFEYRSLGDNSITEAYAFLFDHLIQDPEWLRLRLGIEDSVSLTAYARAHRLVYLRRYAAKLAYELELHGPAGGEPAALAARYSELLGDALQVRWPAETYLADVDPGFYCACYLRAWALETHLRAYLRNRYGDAWFDSRQAGEDLRRLWREGQRMRPEELLGQLTGGQLSFEAMVSDLGV